MKILVLGGKGKSTRAVVNALSGRYENLAVVLENGTKRSAFLKKRIKRYGLRTVLGQILFSMIVPRILNYTGKKRISEIIEEYNLDYTDRFGDLSEVYNVESINDPETIEIIKRYIPDIVIVNGTRIISKTVLDATTCPVINMHVGITPKYRGVHGGYWAMANEDPENCGVTIHHVDQGVDTGSVIAQKKITVTDKDNYVTYPLIQTGEGIKLEFQILEEFEKTGRIESHLVDLPSKMWTHPTLLQYLRNFKKTR